MNTPNKLIAELMYELAYYKKLDGQKVFRTKPYIAGADFMRQFNGNPLKTDLTKFDGIGKKTASCILEAATTGTIQELEKFRKVYVDLRDLEKVSGIGPKKAMTLYNKYGIVNRNALKDILTNGTLEDEKLLKAVTFSLSALERTPRPIVEMKIASVLEILRPLTEKIEVVGSLRRKRDTIKDVDILVVTKDVPLVMKTFASLGEVLSSGPLKSSIHFDAGFVKFQIDLLCVQPESWGAALNYFTGSKEHNVELRTMAKAQGLTVNEHGIFDSNGIYFAGEFEDDLYDLLGLPFIPPVLRDFKLKDITDDMLTSLVNKSYADVHTHTSYSDGKDSVDAMVSEAVRLGLNTIGISDHIAKAIYGNNLMDPNERVSWLKDIEEAQSNHPEIKVLKGAELDVNVAGELQIPDGLDNELDYIIASAHTSPEKNLTNRFLNAMEHPKVKVLGHPSGRQFGIRDVSDADWDLIFSTAANKDVAIEVNGQPPRLDCAESLLKKAKQHGCKVILSSDAHSVNQMEVNLNYAVEVAQRGGCAFSDVKEW